MIRIKEIVKHKKAETLATSKSLQFVHVLIGLIRTGVDPLRACTLALDMLGFDLVDRKQGPKPLQCPKCSKLYTFAPGSVCPDCKVKLVKAE